MTISNSDSAHLTPEEARAAIKAIEDVEREEAAEQDRKRSEKSTD